MSDDSRETKPASDAPAASWKRLVRTRLRRWNQAKRHVNGATRVPSFADALSPNRNFDQLDWRLLSERRWQAVAELGYRLPVSLRSPSGSAATGGGQLARAVAANAPSRSPRSRVGIVSICTASHLPFARTLFEAVRRLHPEAAAFLCISDDPSGAATVLPGVEVIPVSALRIEQFSFLTLKYTATELCCALKPFVLRHLIDTGACEKYVYIDCDVCVYAKLDALADGLNEADFVVTPHMTTPFPGSWNGRVKPTQGDLLYAGVLNAGVFAVRSGDAAAQFLETWAQLVTQNGAFMPIYGGQCEQHAFNWILAFAERVHVLRDRATNVGYWNLHDRSLRWQGFEGGAGWTVDGRPLVCFHFSGFSPEQPFQLSKHQARHHVHLVPSVERLIADYCERLGRHGWRAGQPVPYGYGRFPSGLPVDQWMRDVYKDIEMSLDRSRDPWTPEGEEYFAQALLAAHPATGSLLPPLLQRICRDRPDLLHGYPGSELEPQPMLVWFQHHGLNELPPHYRTLYDTYRPVVPDADAVLQLRRALDDVLPEPGIAQPFTAGRAQLLARLTDSRYRDLRRDLESYKGERYFTSAIRLLWQIYESRPDLRHMFPDVLGRDADRFAEWLSIFGPDELIISPSVQETFARCSHGRSLARIFSVVNRTHWMMERWPLAFVGRDREEFGRVLLTLVRDDLEFDSEDVLMYLWTMHADPYSGLPLALELLHNLAATPSSRLPEGQDRLLADLLRNDPRCREALDRYRRAYPAADADELRRIRSNARTTIDVSEHLASIAAPATNGSQRAASASDDSGPVESGANIFGYFKSPIGLGEMSRGVAAAMRTIDMPAAENVIGNVAMDRDLRPEHFLRTFDYRQRTNIFVSYPHLNSLLLHSYPRWMTSGRRNIVYLAWEQRDSAPHWQHVFADFDQVWALSSFAARSLESQLGRPVHAISCVLDTTALPERLPKRQVGLAEQPFTFLYAVDANSSLERKNPEAVIEAFARAFSGEDGVELCLKVSNAHRLEHRAKLQRILSMAARHPRIRVLTTQLNRRAMLQLIGAADCYVSLHRAEGFGFTCAEAMAFGRPVLATGYSGNLDFMSEDNSWLVKAREVEVEHPEGPFQRGSVWAEIDIDHAAACMRDIVARPDEARLRGARGRADIVRLLSPQAVGASIRRALADVS